MTDMPETIYAKIDDLGRLKLMPSYFVGNYRYVRGDIVDAQVTEAWEKAKQQGADLAVEEINNVFGQIGAEMKKRRSK